MSSGAARAATITTAATTAAAAPASAEPRAATYTLEQVDSFVRLWGAGRIGQHAVAGAVLREPELLMQLLVAGVDVEPVARLAGKAPRSHLHCYRC